MTIAAEVEAVAVMPTLMTATTTTTTTATTTSSSKQTLYFEIKVSLLYLTVFGDMCNSFETAGMTTAAEAAEVMTMMMTTTTTTTTTTITSSSKQTSYFEIKVLLLYLTVFADMYIALIQLE